MNRNQIIFLIAIMTLVFLFTSCKNTGDNAMKFEDNVLDSLNYEDENIDLSIFKKEENCYFLPWEYLINTRFEEVYNEEMKMDVSLPIFSDTLKALAGKKVIIEGFYIPVDETGDDKIVILSAYPFAQCFFCGKAGVESIVDILTTQKMPRLKVDQKIKFKGKLKLNKDNFDFLIFVLEDAELIKP